MRNLMLFCAGLDAVLLAVCVSERDWVGAVVAILAGVACLYSAEVRS